MAGRGRWWVWALLGLGLLYWAGVTVAKIVRGIRNKNPGNLRPMPNGRKWDGEVENDTAKGGPFSRFSTAYYGWRALAIDVFGDIKDRGQNTIKRLVEGTPEKNFQDAYAPASDNNNVKRYIAALVQAVAVKEDFPLNIYLHGPALLRGIAKYENGMDPDLVWGSEPRTKGTQAGLDRVGGGG